ncbi:bifunctional Nucleic acid-binding [Babesia duncani]|uniref:Bifunctional Nucleic acid-binding n=1 Tax=Babesia duncani TaxID=323732 RepID=A0AAD9PI31_9APIC|nr:bifunctional Nucleic acid-binding [Babesia duncani]
MFVGILFLFIDIFTAVYGNIKRSIPSSIEFETGYPKERIEKPIVSVPYTQEINQRLVKSSESRQQLTKARVIEQLSVRRVKFGGRNATGKITTRHRGGGHVQRIRLVDFKRQRKDIYATVLRIEYDATRSAYVALIQYDDGVLSYILCPAGVIPGHRLVASMNAQIAPGNCLPLRHIPVGFFYKFTTASASLNRT